MRAAWALLFLLPGCSWGPLVLRPEALPSVAMNVLADRVEDLQSEGAKKGRIPRRKDPVLEWGPLRVRADGKLRLQKERGLCSGERRARNGVSKSLSLKLSSSTAYLEIKFRF